MGTCKESVPRDPLAAANRETTRPVKPPPLPLKILFISGSSESQAKIYFDALRSRYADISVGWYAPDCFVLDRHVSGQSSRHEVFLPRLPRYLVLLYQWMRVFWYAIRSSRQGRFDLLVSAGIQGALLFPALRIFRCSRRFVYIAGDWFPCSRWWLFLDGKASRLADETWNLTRAIRQARIAAHKLPAGKEGPVVGALFSEPSPHARSEAPKGQPYFCYLGRAWAGRGVDTAIEAMAILKKRGVALGLVITGPQKNDEMDFLRKIAAGAGVEDQVRWTGFLPLSDLNALLQRSLFGLAVFPGGADNYSNFTEPAKVSHCLQLGVPVIISKANAMAAEVLENGAGVLVDDSPEDLANAMERFCADPAFALQAGAQAHALAKQRASPDVLFGQIERVAGAANGGEQA